MPPVKNKLLLRPSKITLLVFILIFTACTSLQSTQHISTPTIPTVIEPLLLPTINSSSSTQDLTLTPIVTPDTVK